MKKEFTSEKGRTFRRDDAGRSSNFDKDRRNSAPRKNSFNPNFDENNRFIGGSRNERLSRDGGFNRDSRPSRDGGFNRDSRPSRDGGYERTERPARSFNREGGYDRSERTDRSERSFSREGRPSREGGFNRDSRPSRDGGYERTERPARSFNREGRPSREGGFNRDSRPNREGGFNKERTERPARSFNREGGYDRSERSFSREGRPSREGGFNRDSRPNREGGFNKERSFNREGRPNREGGFNRDSRPNREGGYERTERPARSFNREGGYNKERSFDRKPNRNKDNYPRFEAKVSSEVRLNRYVSNSGVCSRREADDLITAGLVSVNGEIVTELGTKVKPSDVIRFNDEVIKGEKNVYILMNKPKGFVTTIEDPHADKTVMDLLRDACTERIYPVGRLDKNTMGVLLFTNDGELTKKLTHPSYNKAKIYQVSLDRSMNQADMLKLESGIVLEDGEIKADDVSFVGETRKEVGIEIHSGRNRIVRRMFDAVGYNVEKLDRVYFAGLTKKNLKRGAWRFLTQQEVIALKNGQYR